MWRDTKLKRVAYCGRVVSSETEAVAVMVTQTPEGPRAGFSGLQTCGSVWACPVCSEKINAGRQAELEAGMKRWLDQGGGVEFLTLTVRHNRRHRLAAMLDAISPAWNRTTSGAGVAWNGGKHTIGDKALFGIVGYVRLLEGKHGDNGWHPHVHALLFTKAPLSSDDREQLRHRLFGRWDKALRKEGFSALEFDQHGHAVGADLRPVTSSAVADYFAKNTYKGAAYEVTGSHSKQAGKGGRTPFQILGDLVVAATGELPEGWSPEAYAADRRLWSEWEEATKGRRQITWSRGMRALLLPDVAELTDEQLAGQDAGGEVVHVFTAEEWRERKLWRVRVELLEAAESGSLRRLFAAERAARPGAPPGQAP